MSLPKSEPCPDENSAWQDASPSEPLIKLLAEVAMSGYAFTTPTPLTHQRYVSQRSAVPAASLRDIFGWNLNFAPQLLTPGMLRAMRDAAILSEGDFPRSAVRIASIEGDLFLHSSFPTDAANSVFFGPDTYRFVSFLRQARCFSAMNAGRVHEPIRVLDIGCGSGAGGLIAGRILDGLVRPYRITLTDINPLALLYSKVNAAVAGIPVTVACSDGLSAVRGEFDLIISNPPYLYDDSQRAYRHGGAGLGRDLSVRFLKEALPRLAPGGELLLYTGVAIVDGVDPFFREIMPLIGAQGYLWCYREIDPDVFSEELTRPIYQHADRIAVVGLTVSRVSTG